MKRIYNENKIFYYSYYLIALGALGYKFIGEILIALGFTHPKLCETASCISKFNIASLLGLITSCAFLGGGVGALVAAFKK